MLVTVQSQYLTLKKCLFQPRTPDQNCNIKHNNPEGESEIIKQLYTVSTILALAVHVALPGLRDVHQRFIVIFVFISIFSHLFFRQPLSVLYFKFLDGERTFEIIKASCITMWLLSELTSEPETRLRARERRAIARKVFMAELSKKN